MKSILLIKRFIVIVPLTILIFSAGTFRAKAQCYPAIESTAVIVDSTQTINGGFDPIWVCPADTLHSDGGFHNTYLEYGSIMTTGGGIDSIYVKGGASFFMNGGIHVIYYLADTDLHIAGGIPTLILCDSLAFDYTDAPEGGCIPTGIVTIAENLSEGLVYPNPVSTKINFDLTNYASDNYTFDIYNACGKRMAHETITQSLNSIDAENFASGIYFYTLRNKEEVLARGKFIVE